MKDAQNRALSAIGEAASEWVVLLAGAAATAADKAAFMEWLRQSPLHVQEYLRAEVAFLALQGATNNDATDIKTLLMQVPPHNVVELAVARPGEQESARGSAGAAAASRRRKIRFLAAAAVAVLAIGVALGPRLLSGIHARTYTTATGEQRRVVLADGSTIDLNTQTRLRVRFSGAARDIELSEGEAYFTVAKDPARPFTVTAGNRQVRALGTAFIVRGDERRVSVTLIEGKVTVAPVRSLRDASKSGEARAGAQPVPLALAPGQRVTFVSNGATAQLDSPAIAKVTAWRERRLIFEDQTIAEVAAEFNRYNSRQIVIEDPALGEERINGVFDADKPRNLLDFLIQNTGARIEERAGSLALTRAAPSR